MMGDALGDRMKMYEKVEAGRRFLPLLPVIARLDGRSFSSYTRTLAKPFDVRFCDLMQHVTRKLVEETGAKMGYTQSDEISLVFYSDDLNSQIFFDGKVQKMVSVLTSLTTSWFMLMLPKLINDVDFRGKPVNFDCRVWQVPNKTEATNALLWREFDATKNSIQSAARALYSHKELMGKHTGEMQEMIFQKGINWNDYPEYFKRGSFFQRVTELRKFTTEELARLPEKHAARQNPDLEIMRQRVKRLEMPPFSKVINRVQVVFDGATPITTDLSEEVEKEIQERIDAV